jgi:hypothetical protein
MQLMGGYGYSKEYPAEQRLRDAWGWGIAGGTIDIQKINIAAALAGRRFNQRGLRGRVSLRQKEIRNVRSASIRRRTLGPLLG